MALLIITKNEAEKILNLRESCKSGVPGAAEIKISLDLGLTLSSAYVKDDSVRIGVQEIPVSDFRNIKEDFCYVIEDNTLKKIAFFSGETNLYYKLLPTKDWPTVTMSSVPMHRHTGMSPKEDTFSKIKEIGPVKGNVLDTCCGLGYTAIMASKQAEEVHTFERDETMLHIAGLNPHSQGLFSGRKTGRTEKTGKKIIIHKEDVFSGITGFKDSYFDRIIHDPPTFKISPELYSAKFCGQLFRVLKKGGILYHYAPWPGKTKGNEFYKKIMKNLVECGFKNIEYHAGSSGVRAVKI